MVGQLVVVEGFDGSGKSELIGGLLETCGRHRPVVAIGRKHEPELAPISALIEDEGLDFAKDTEMLLRLSLEAERQHLIRRALRTHDLVLLDRALISLSSWVDYYELSRIPYDGALNHLETLLVGALHLFCEADFETCWSRIDSPLRVKSKKERLGKETNRGFYGLYHDNATVFTKRLGPMIRIDTANAAISECVGFAVRAIQDAASFSEHRLKGEP